LSSTVEMSSNLQNEFKKTLSEKCSPEMVELTNCKVEVRKVLSNLKTGNSVAPLDQVDFSKVNLKF
jgi:hypothetical protein